jgi:Zn-dependent M28 family amino/carboxypeptidase
VVNVVATQRGRSDPDRFLVMTAHYDSRATDVMDARVDAPGANDDASGVAATLEAARLLSRYPTDATIVYAALAGEEQGLFGGGILAAHAKAGGWRVEAVLNNDVVGNTRGSSGVVDNTTVRLFAPRLPPTRRLRSWRASSTAAATTPPSSWRATRRSASPSRPRATSGSTRTCAWRVAYPTATCRRRWTSPTSPASPR